MAMILKETTQGELVTQNRDNPRENYERDDAVANPTCADPDEYIIFFAIHLGFN